jgi:hypothetical protein
MCVQVCIVALTACILEMADSMYKLLPEVLLNLSKISATVHIAIPVLEFLSTLIRSGLASDSCPFSLLLIDNNCLKPFRSMLRIRDILVRIRISGSIPLITDPDPTLDPAPDPAIFVSFLQDGNKQVFFLRRFFC